MVAILVAMLLGGVPDTRYSGYWHNHKEMQADCPNAVLDSEVVMASYSLTPDGGRGRLLIVFERDGKLAQIYSPARSLMDPCPKPLEASLAILKSYAIELLAYDKVAMIRLISMER